MQSILQIKRQRLYDPNAVIYNFSGHPILPSIKEELRERGHKKLIIFNRGVHIDVNKCIEEQVEKELDALLTTKNIEGKEPQNIVADRYFISCGHAVTNLLLFTGLTSLFGSAPLLIVTGNDETKCSTYELKSIIAVKSWIGKWRSNKRQKYTIKESEIIEIEPVIKEHEIANEEFKKQRVKNIMRTGVIK